MNYTTAPPLIHMYPSLPLLFVLSVNPISAQSAKVLVFPSLCSTLCTDVKQRNKGHASVQVLLICFSFSSSYGGWLRKGLSDDSRADKADPRCGPQHGKIWLDSQQVKHFHNTSIWSALKDEQWSLKLEQNAKAADLSLWQCLPVR